MEKAMRSASVAVAFLVAMALAEADAAERNPFNSAVLDVRPRIFLRDGGFEGLTVERLRARIGKPEFAGARQKWRARPMGRGLLWLLEGSREDLDAAIAGLKQMEASKGSWSDRGPALIQLAALFDWLYEDLDEATRLETIRKIENAANDATHQIHDGQAPFFYSRTPGALAGLCVAGLALSGVSENADDYLRTFREYGVDEFFKAYQWVDGAATGATYTMSYTYVDLPAICAAWWSATDHNPADWIEAEQGDWLGGIVRFYLWYMRPGFAFTHINDQFRRSWDSHDEYCQGLDIAAYVTRDGYGRSWSERWRGRFGRALYHQEHAYNLIFHNTSLARKPLTDLPLAELFGRDSCGYGFFRSEWPKENEPDVATHVFFRCGDPMNVHGGVAAGEFQIFKHTPLAASSGRYGSYDSPPDQYHRNCVSTNVVLFTNPAVPDDRGDQHTCKGLKTDHRNWAEWFEIRQRHGMDVAQILDWQVRPGEARCRADLTKTNPLDKCRRWIREFVWLANKHLVVLDVVQTAEPGIRRQWQLHMPTRPKIGDRLLTVTSRAPQLNWSDPKLKPKSQEGRLFCQTLLPHNYRLILYDDGKAEAFASIGTSLGPVEGSPFHREFGQQLVQIDPGNDHTHTLFLHVLTATESDEVTPPRVSFRLSEPGKLVVFVDGNETRLAVPKWFAPHR